MLKTTITWYKPEEKTPENREVIALCDTGYLATVYVYNGHFNCSSSDFSTEIKVVAWAEIPQKLKEEADKAWHEERREEIEKCLN